jgi:hypothetical protein
MPASENGEGVFSLDRESTIPEKIVDFNGYV